MKIEEIEIEKIKPYEKNPRKNNDAVKYVAESIKEFGFKVPVIIDKNYVIVTGHTRYKAANKLQLKTIPCIIAEDLSEEQIKAFRLADNKVSEKSEWDMDLLNEELQDILNIDMSIFDFEFENIDEPFEEERKDNSSKICEEYSIIIECEDETELESTYNQLCEEGYNCRILT